MKLLIKARDLTTETVCQLFLSLIVEHFAIWNEGTIFRGTQRQIFVRKTIWDLEFSEHLL